MEDCIIIGAGAAGLFAAGAAVHAGKRVTVLEHMDAPVSYTHLTLPTILLV